MMSCSSFSQVKVREVWGHNLESELSLVRECLGRFRIASFDTEFPGNIFTTNVRFSKLSPSQLYSLMKRNVDSLKLIQFGLTLSDANGNLPTFGTQSRYVWQFNFRDFDPDCDIHNPESIAFLRTHGMDFDKNRDEGIDSRTFAPKFIEFGLDGLTWTTFDGLYDLGYLIKILTGGRQLPRSYDEFTMLKQALLGAAIHDTKEMANQLGLYGGLEKICKSLNLERVAGNSHEAGSDCLLTMHLFLELKKYFLAFPILVVNKFNHQIVCCSTGLSPKPVFNRVPAPLIMY